MNQAINLSLQFENQEKEKFAVRSFQDIKDKLSLLTLTNWSMWFPDEHHIIFMQPRKINNIISVDLYLQVGTDLLANAFFRGDSFPISKSCISDIREVETLLCEISLNSLDTLSYHQRVLYLQINIIFPRLRCILLLMYYILQI